LQQIKDDEYLEVLKKIAGEKFASLKNEPRLAKQKKTFDYLLQRGFETDLVQRVLGEDQDADA